MQVKSPGSVVPGPPLQAEADACVPGGEGLSDVLLGFFTNGEGFVVLGLFEGFFEGCRGAAPIADGVAMDSCGFRCRG